MIYLYVKTHNRTNMKYLGKTSSKNPYTYKGSGKYWKNHIKKHGYDVTTIILLCAKCEKEISETGVFFSKLFNVVESKEWANLKEEKGDGGWDHINNDNKTREKIHKSKKEKYGNDYMKNLISEDANKKRKDTCIKRYDVHNSLLNKEVRMKQKDTMERNYGVTVPYHSEEIKNRGKETMMKKYGVENPGQMESTKKKISDSWKEKQNNPQKYKKRCINDGKKTIKIGYKQPLPEGFFEGGLPHENISITNGKETKTIHKSDVIPDGWVIGNTRKRGKIVVNNGIVEKRISNTEVLPEGFVVGGIKRKFYTNGVENKRLKEGDNIPDGFYSGRTL
jgi:hypothetical protein